MLQCSWCGRILRMGKPPISHGMCRECADELLKQMEAADGKREA